MRRIVFSSLCLLLFFVGLAEWQLGVLRADYRQGQVSGNASIRLGTLYLPVRQRLFSDPGAQIAVAFRVVRQSESQDFVFTMRQAGIGLGMLLEVFRDSDVNTEYQNEAAFEALILLTRMPWDEDFSQEASRLSAHLRGALSQNASATLDERQMIEEVLELVAVRQGAGRVPAVPPNTVSTDERKAWEMGLQAVRLGLASCLKTPEPPLNAAWAALERGFGQNWLRREWVAGWDAGLQQALHASRASADCQRLAARLSSMAIAVDRSPP
nr:hypothetical protein [uncultured Rhodoferax sp.]